jgi:hypothetical protein
MTSFGPFRNAHDAISYMRVLSLPFTVHGDFNNGVGYIKSIESESTREDEILSMRKYAASTIRLVLECDYECDNLDAHDSYVGKEVTQPEAKFKIGDFIKQKHWSDVPHHWYRVTNFLDGNQVEVFAPDTNSHTSYPIGMDWLVKTWT